MKLLFLILLISFKAQAISFKEWQILSTEAKVEFLSDHSGELDIDLNKRKITYVRMSAARLKQLQGTITHAAAKLLRYESYLPTEVDDEFYATVGGLKKSATLFFSDDNKFIGANVYISQSGCSHMDEEDDFVEQGGHYETVKQAEANRCFDNDVSWSGNSIVDETFTEIFESGYMEWSGH